MRRLGPWMLLVLLVAGFLAAQLSWIDWREALALSERHAHRWWLPVSVMAVMAAMFTFAFPGSALFWVAGILYPPSLATPMVVIGGLMGSLGAYRVAGSVGRSWARERSGGLLGFLRTRGDFLTLLAVRTLPTFPHSVINYSAGMLEVPVTRFVMATTAGLLLKGWLYTTAIHHAARADALDEALTPRVVAPLLGLAILFLVAGVVRRRWGLADPGETKGDV